MTLVKDTKQIKHLIKAVASFSLWWEANPNIVDQNCGTNAALDASGSRDILNEKKKQKRLELGEPHWRIKQCANRESAGGDGDVEDKGDE